MLTRLKAYFDYLDSLEKIDKPRDIIALLFLSLIGPWLLMIGVIALLSTMTGCKPIEPYVLLEEKSNKWVIVGETNNPYRP